MSITTAEDPTPQAADSAPTALPPGVEPLLTTAGLMEYYGVSNWTVNDWVQRGCPVEPTAFRGRRFDRAKVRDWMAGEAAAMAQTA